MRTINFTLFDKFWNLKFIFFIEIPKLLCHIKVKILIIDEQLLQ
jgi:hypothetical protein